jgi:hypothetical protein
MALMLALVNNEVQALRVVQQALDVDLMLGARLAGEVKPEFQSQTIKFVEELEVPAWLKGQLLRKPQSHYAVSALLKLLDCADADVFIIVAMILGEFIPDNIIMEFFARASDKVNIYESISEELNNALADDADGFIDFFETLEQLEPKVLFRTAILAISQLKMSQDNFLELAIPALFRLIENGMFDVTLVKILEKMFDKINLNTIHPDHVELMEKLGKQMEEKLLNTINLGNRSGG